MKHGCVVLIPDHGEITKIKSYKGTPTVFHSDGGTLKAIRQQPTMISDSLVTAVKNSAQPSVSRSWRKNEMLKFRMKHGMQPIVLAHLVRREKRF